jgi:hypothetical protein
MNNILIWFLITWCTCDVYHVIARFLPMPCCVCPPVKKQVMFALDINGTINVTLAVLHLTFKLIMSLCPCMIFFCSDMLCPSRAKCACNCLISIALVLWLNDFLVFCLVWCVLERHMVWIGVVLKGTGVEWFGLNDWFFMEWSGVGAVWIFPHYQVELWVGNWRSSNLSCKLIGLSPVFSGWLLLCVFVNASE